MQGTPEASGDFLKFFHREGQTRIAVQISARALRECFSSVQGTSLLNIYLANVDDIHELVRRCLRAGVPMPLQLFAGDVRRLSPADARGGQRASPGEPCDPPTGLGVAPECTPWLPAQARVQLNGAFSVEQLEALARWMRSKGAPGSTATPGTAFGGHSASSGPGQPGPVLPSKA